MDEILGAADYHDAVGGRHLPVRLARHGRVLRLVREDGRTLAEWPGRDVRSVPGPQPDGGGRFSVMESGDVAIVVEDERTLRNLLAAFPSAVRRPRRPHGWLRGAGMVVAGAVAVLMIAVFLLPATSESLARMVPVALERRIGDQSEQAVVGVLATLQKRGDADALRCRSSDGQAAIEGLAARLSPPGTDPVRITVVSSPLVNAFALPGGRVVVTSGLIAFAGEPAALAGVMAHEIGHIAEWHALAGMMRSVLTGAVLGVVFGDFGFGAVTSMMGALVEADYSQTQERKADRYAVDALKAAGIPLEPLARLFERLAERERDETSGWEAALSNWLSTHPATADRTAAIRAMDDPGRNEPGLTPAEWRALGSMCGPPP
ncbi:MAG TPA: M48 family metallopeptidase [Azospirillaceae bacterium]|nr:M48 family metallopeptidase [Azospirillaceae bacterium]